MNERFLRGTVPPDRVDLRFDLINNGARANPNANYVYEISPDLTLVARYVVPVRQYGRYKGMLDYDAINVPEVAVAYTVNGEPVSNIENVKKFLTGEWTTIEQHLAWQDEDFKNTKLFKRGGWE